MADEEIVSNLSLDISEAVAAAERFASVLAKDITEALRLGDREMVKLARHEQAVQIAKIESLKQQQLRADKEVAAARQQALLRERIGLDKIREHERTIQKELKDSVNRAIREANGEVRTRTNKVARADTAVGQREAARAARQAKATEAMAAAEARRQSTQSAAPKRQTIKADLPPAIAPSGSRAEATLAARQARALAAEQAKAAKAEATAKAKLEKQAEAASVKAAKTAAAEAKRAKVAAAKEATAAAKRAADLQRKAEKSASTASTKMAAATAVEVAKVVTDKPKTKKQEPVPVVQVDPTPQQQAAARPIKATAKKAEAEKPIKVVAVEPSTALPAAKTAKTAKKAEAEKPIKVVAVEPDTKQPVSKTAKAAKKAAEAQLTPPPVADKPVKKPTKAEQLKLDRPNVIQAKASTAAAIVDAAVNRSPRNKSPYIRPLDEIAKSASKPAAEPKPTAVAKPSEAKPVSKTVTAASTTINASLTVTEASGATTAKGAATAKQKPAATSTRAAGEFARPSGAGSGGGGGKPTRTASGGFADDDEPFTPRSFSRLTAADRNRLLKERELRQARDEITSARAAERSKQTAARRKDREAERQAELAKRKEARDQELNERAAARASVLARGRSFRERVIASGIQKNQRLEADRYVELEDTRGARDQARSLIEQSNQVRRSTALGGGPATRRIQNALGYGRKREAASADISAFQTAAAEERNAARERNRIQREIARVEEQMAHAQRSAAEANKTGLPVPAFATNANQQRLNEYREQLTAQKSAATDRLKSASATRSSAASTAMSAVNKLTSPSGFGKLLNFTGAIEAGLTRAFAPLMALKIGYDAVKRLVGGLGDLIKMGSALQESTSALEMVFGVHAGIIKSFGESGRAADDFGLSIQKLYEQTARYGAALEDAGMSQKAAGESALSLAKIGQDISSFHNIGTDRAQAAVMSGLTGQTKPLKTLGITGLGALSVAKEARKLKVERGDMSLDISEQDKVLARERIIQRKTAGIIQGDFKRTSGNFANSAKTLQAEVANTLGKLGLALQPAATGLIKSITGVVTTLGKINFKPFAAGFSLIVKPIQTTIWVFEKLATAATFTLDQVTRAFVAVATSDNPIIKMIDRIVSTVAVGTSNLGKLGDVLSVLMADVKAAAGGVGGAVSSVTTSVKSGVAKMAGWAQDGVDRLAENISNAKDTVSEAAGNVADAITDPFEAIADMLFGAKDRIVFAIQAIIDEFKSAAGVLTDNPVFRLAASGAGSLAKAGSIVKSNVSAVAGSIGGKIADVKNAAVDEAISAKKAVGEKVGGAAKTASRAAGAAKKAVSGAIDAMPSGALGRAAASLEGNKNNLWRSKNNAASIAAEVGRIEDRYEEKRADLIQQTIGLMKERLAVVREYIQAQRDSVSAELQLLQAKGSVLSAERGVKQAQLALSRYSPTGLTKAEALSRKYGDAQEDFDAKDAMIRAKHTVATSGRITEDYNESKYQAARALIPAQDRVDEAKRQVDRIGRLDYDKAREKRQSTRAVRDSKLAEKTAQQAYDRRNREQEDFDNQKTDAERGVRDSVRTTEDVVTSLVRRKLDLQKADLAVVRAAEDHTLAVTEAAHADDILADAQDQITSNMLARIRAQMQLVDSQKNLTQLQEGYASSTREARLAILDLSDAELARKGMSLDKQEAAARVQEAFDTFKTAKTSKERQQAGASIARAQLAQKQANNAYKRSGITLEQQKEQTALTTQGASAATAVAGRPEYMEQLAKAAQEALAAQLALNQANREANKADIITKRAENDKLNLQRKITDSDIAGQEAIIGQTEAQKALARYDADKADALESERRARQTLTRTMEDAALVIDRITAFETALADARQNTTDATEDAKRVDEDSYTWDVKKKAIKQELTDAEHDQMLAKRNATRLEEDGVLVAADVVKANNAVKEAEQALEVAKANRNQRDEDTLANAPTLAELENNVAVAKKQQIQAYIDQADLEAKAEANRILLTEKRKISESEQQEIFKKHIDEKAAKLGPNSEIGKALSTYSASLTSLDKEFKSIMTFNIAPTEEAKLDRALQQLDKFADPRESVLTTLMKLRIDNKDADLLKELFGEVDGLETKKAGEIAVATGNNDTLNYTTGSGVSKKKTTTTATKTSAKPKNNWYGSIVTEPTLTWVGEMSKREVIIPLEQGRDRAAQLARESGLLDLIGPRSSVVTAHNQNSVDNSRNVQVTLQGQATPDGANALARRIIGRL